MNLGHIAKLNSQLQILQIVPKFSAQIFALQRELNRSFQKSQFISSVVAAAFVDVGIKLLTLEQPAKPVGELQLAARARFDVR